MRIGIVTFWSSEDNYGQQLQMYALYKHIESLGHEPFIVNYDGSADATLRNKLSMRIWKAMREPQMILPFFRSLIRSRKTSKPSPTHDSGFAQFREKMFQWSRHYTSYAELCQDPPQADIFICGSDMIWCESAKYRPYFLDFVKGAKKIAYAPSFGAPSISNSYKEVIKGLLSSFNAISARELSGSEICHSMGFDHAKWLPDPTILLQKEEYEVIAKREDTDSKYIFMYLLGHHTNVPTEQIDNFAARHNLQIRYRASQKRYDTLPKVYPTIEEWIGYMSGAEYIITNSFHGCIMAIILQKRFIYLPLIGDSQPRNERSYSILNRLSLNDRIWRGEIEIITKDIDYKRVETELAEWVDQAKEYLKEAIWTN